jgi:biotin-(acetyl-CoA carboxylase) ligase
MVAQAEKEKIEKEDLPAAAIKHLGEKYKGWNVGQAYRVKAKDQQGNEKVEFEVELEKAGQAQVIKFDKDGNLKL